MATTTKSRKTKTAAKPAKTSIIRRSALAYVGLHSLAYDRLTNRIEKNRELGQKFFGDLVAKGETLEQQSGGWFDSYKQGLERRHAKRVEFAKGLLPAGAKGKVATLEAELEELTETLDKLSKKAKKTAAAKAKSARKSVKAAAETVSEKVEDLVEDTQDKIEDVVETVAETVDAAQAQLFKTDDKVEKLAKAKAAVAQAVKPAQ